MITNSIVKSFVGSIILFSVTAEAWTVAEWVVDSPQDKHSAQFSTEMSQPTATAQPFDLSIAPAKAPETKILALPPQHKAAQFEKRETQLTTEEEASGDFRQALNHRDNGEFLEAERLLKTALIQMPTHHAARVELATLYLKRNQLEETEMLLSEGFRLDENNPDFLRLMAIIHDKREEPEKALALLVRVKDSRRRDKNYVAFLGHIYQQMGRFALARQQYYRLLQEEPENSLWLLGVSLALDGEGQKEAALEGYKKITADGSINPHVLQYVEERMKALKG
jgi:MSHA biogenesis protein MshN